MRLVPFFIHEEGSPFVYAGGNIFREQVFARMQQYLFWRMGILNCNPTKEMIMKTFVYRIFAAIVVVTSLSGCGTTKQESAMEWLQRQPVVIDP